MGQTMKMLLVLSMISVVSYASQAQNSKIAPAKKQVKKVIEEKKALIIDSAKAVINDKANILTQLNTDSTIVAVDSTMNQTTEAADSSRKVIIREATNPESVQVVEIVE